MVEIDRYERWFMLSTVALLVGAAVALIISLAGHHAALPEPAGRIDPAEVRETAPFDRPGLVETGPGEYDLVVIGQAWQWTPAEVTIPKGAVVDIIATTVDVTHGIRIPDTNANGMVIPGQITEIKDVLFDEEGAYSLICHEYCGIGHHNMGGLIIVE